MSVGKYYITGGASLPVQASVNAYASAASLAAADTTVYNQATVLAGGYWEWQTGDKTAVYAADTTLGIPNNYAVVKSSASAITVGAWIRQFEGFAMPSHFGGDVAKAVKACYALNVPMRLRGAAETGTLSINAATDATANTNAARGLVLSNAVAWASSCYCTGGAEIIVRETGLGRIAIEAQMVKGSFASGGDPQAVVLQMVAVQLIRIDDTGGIPIVYGAKVARATRTNISTPGTGHLSGGSGTFAVTATGGGGTGYAGTAYVTAGVVTGVTTDNRGLGWTSAPTPDFTAGGGTGTVGTISVNLNVVPVTITCLTLPASAVVGQPVGVQNPVGTAPAINDAGGCAGGGIITAINTGTRQITFEMTQTQATAMISPTAMTFVAGGSGTSNVVFPQTWYEVQGVFTGSLSGTEGFINASNKAAFILQYFSVCWGDGPNQLAKTAQVGIGGGTGLGRIEVRDSTVFGNFPNAQVRLNQGNSYIQRLYAFAGIQGADCIKLQGGGDHQVTSCHMGGANGGSGMNIAAGVRVELSACSIGACNVGISNTGGGRSFLGTRISNCLTGLNTTAVGESAVDATNIINRCNISAAIASGGSQVGQNTQTNQISTAGGLDTVYPPGSELECGFYLASSATTKTRTYFSGKIFEGVGTGTPEGVVAADVGSKWTDTAGAAGARVWYKATNAWPNATGWVAATTP